MALELFDNLERAEFLDRPNRFIARCRLGGRTVTAHLPNPGRMWELLLPGATLLVARRAPRSGLRTACTVAGVEKDGAAVLLHTQRTNDAARHLIEQGRLPAFRGYAVTGQEHTVGRSRFDLVLEGPKGRMLLEVKSCTLFGHGVAMFPDAVTERGRRHLAHLAELSAAGQRTGVLFLVHYPRVDWFLPDYHTDPAFSRTFLAVKDAVMLRAVAVGWDEGLRLCEDRVRELAIPYGVITRESIDGGVYIIILRLDRGRDIAVGSLGLRHFKKGYYLYVGSARKNLQARMDRHRRGGKARFWHIDYLRAEAAFCAAVPVRGTLATECGLAAAVSGMAAWQVPGFGCSDCSCPSHLFALATDPRKSPAFIDLLLEKRMAGLAPLLRRRQAQKKEPV